MNRQTINSPNGDEWFTPMEIIASIRELYGNNWLDVASSDLAQSYINAPRYFTKEDNALTQRWTGQVWMNPPYSQPLISQFTAKLINDHSHGYIEEAVALTNASTDTRWCQQMLKSCTLCIFISGRLSFWHPDKKAGRNPTGQILFYFGDRTVAFNTLFGLLGVKMAF